MSGFKNIFLCIAVFIIAVSASAQKYQFKKYSIEEGLSHPFVYTINQDKNGFIWVGTGEGLCQFDGYEFKVSAIDDSLTNGLVATSYLDKKGNLWFGHNTGQITFYDGIKFQLLNDNGFAKSTITSISEDEKGNLFFSTQNNGIIKLSEELKIDTFYYDFKGLFINSLLLVNNNLMVGSGNGLDIFIPDKNAYKHLLTISELEYISITSINKGNQEGYYWIGTEDSGFYLLKTNNNFDTYEIINMGAKYNLEFDNIQSVLEDSENVLWVSNFGKGLYKLIPEDSVQDSYKDIIHFSTSNGLPHNYIKQVFRDWENNLWIATYGNGLAFSVDQAFTILYQDIDELNKDILSVTDCEKYLWLGGENVIVQVNKENDEYKILDTKNGLPKDKVVALYVDQYKDLWIGLEKEGIFKLKIGTTTIKRFYKSLNSLENSINSITGVNDLVYVSSQNGILIFDQKTGETYSYNTSNGLPHNNIKAVFIDSDFNPWVATSSNGIFVLDSDQKYTIESNANLKFTSITQDSDGYLWAATYGVGVFKFEEDTLKYYSAENGLKSNYCYSIIADDYGKIWVGHRLGISSIDIKTGEINIFSTDVGINGDCNDNTVHKQESGVILTGTKNGLVRYDGSKAKEEILAPKLNITELQLSDKQIDFNKPINLPYKIYKMRISFVGLSYQNPEGVTYQYKLDGYDLEWSDFTKNRVVNYPRIEDGNYQFLVKACNSSGVCVDEPLKIEIIIRAPIWKRWWFISLMVIAGLLTILFVIKYRERKQKILQEYLENELDARTKEVIKQKDELDIKNRDITDSINYAQRIQQSILPSVTTINEYFTDSFVYYKPRDIVSGDFYWFDKVNNDKFLIVCADSTGHGVPGAFMSMIGTTLIKDICLRKDVDSPSEILRKLDRELQSTLNQNIDAERANDGMDIIVCEIDVNTNYMRFSSAMRPVILYKDKELQYVKGTKASIGGDPKAEKQFENIGFQLNKGDIIYMFSDGYPDQFGGPRGKKFKLDRVKNMLADVCDKPMENQEDYVDKVFIEWKGKLQQVDDVLFMGVRI